MRELQFRRYGHLTWAETTEPVLREPQDAIVRPFLAGRCDGDTLPLHRPVSRALQAGIALGLVDPIVGCLCGEVPFRGPFAIGHECVAEITALGSGVTRLSVGDRVIVPWAVSCGTCTECRRGLTSKCATARRGRPLAAYGFGPASGPWGGMIADRFRVPFAEHMLVPVPDDVPAERVVAAGDNLADAYRAVIPPLAARESGSVLVLGGGAKSIGLYAAGLAAATGASTVDYVDSDPARLAVADSFGARPRTRLSDQRYDVVVEATSRPSGLRRALRALSPGGICTAVGYYLSTGTRVPLMHMYATDATLHLGVSHPRAVLPELLELLRRTAFPAERVTTHTAPWDDAPHAYTTRTTKLVLRREPLA